MLLVCHDDGIAALSYEEVKKILKEVPGHVEWISVARGKRQMYTIKGSEGKLEYKIGHNEFPAKIFVSTISGTK